MKISVQPLKCHKVHNSHNCVATKTYKIGNYSETGQKVCFWGRVESKSAMVRKNPKRDYNFGLILLLKGGQFKNFFSYIFSELSNPIYSS